MTQVELAGTRKGLQDLQSSEPYFTIVVSGRTKGNQMSGAKFGIPCVAITEGSGLQPGKWVRRLVEVRMLNGRAGN